MNTIRTQRKHPSSFLAYVRLVSLIIAAAFFCIGLTVLVPPWEKVRSERQYSVFGWLHHKDLETSFAGYHFVLGGKSWQADAVKPPVVAASE